MSETPRTDALLSKLLRSNPWWCDPRIPSFMRHLETELTAMTDERDKLKAEVERLRLRDVDSNQLLSVLAAGVERLLNEMNLGPLNKGV